MAVRKTRDLMTLSLRKMQSELDKLPAQAYDFFVKATPKDTGNARRRTRLQDRRVISADYPYAGVLDKGRHMTPQGMRGSKQAPQGMTKPTEKFIQDRLKKIMRK